MATKKYELTKEYFFHGEFWHQLDDNKGRFSARIEYSPYHGLILDYCIWGSKPESQKIPSLKRATDSFALR
ncbi:TPA: hypothetical protein ACGD52_001784 [Shigella flexneri]